MPDYTVTVVRKKVILDAVVITAANQGAAETEAIKRAKTTVLEREVGSVVYEVE